MNCLRFRPLIQWIAGAAGILFLMGMAGCARSRPYLPAPPCGLSRSDIQPPACDRQFSKPSSAPTACGCPPTTWNPSSPTRPPRPHGPQRPSRAACPPEVHDGDQADATWLWRELGHNRPLMILLPPGMTYIAHRTPRHSRRRDRRAGLVELLDATAISRALPERVFSPAANLSSMRPVARSAPRRAPHGPHREQQLVQADFGSAMATTAAPRPPTTPSRTPPRPGRISMP